jgi:hypothetical protein
LPHYRPDILLELPERRTEFLVNLIAIFEKQELPRFKLYVSNSFSIKEELNIKSIKDKTGTEKGDESGSDEGEETKGEVDLSRMTSSVIMQHTGMSE